MDHVQFQSKMDQRLDAREQRFEIRFERIDSRFSRIHLMFGITMVAVTIPVLQKFLG